MQNIHLFICTGLACTLEGAEENLEALQKGLKQNNLRRKVRVSLVRCLGQCGHGPNLVIYPESTWYAKLRESDIERIIQTHFIDGDIIQDLVHQPLDTEAS
jgi:(2Fe-2S) ferredoxin